MESPTQFRETDTCVLRFQLVAGAHHDKADSWEYTITRLN